MRKTFPLFLYTCCLTISLPIFYPSLSLFYFIPFLILSFYQYSLPSCLWWALICGSIVDLLSAHTRLGIYALNYCLTTWALYHYHLHFFEDRWSTLPLLTFCFASLSAIIQAGIFYTIETPFFLSWEWIKNDLVWIPLQNALYALLAFTFPSQFLFKVKWVPPLFFLTRRKRI